MGNNLSLSISAPLHKYVFPFLERLFDLIVINRVMITMVVPDGLEIGQYQESPFSPYKVVFVFESTTGMERDASPIWVYNIVQELRGMEVTLIVSPHRQTSTIHFGIVIDMAEDMEREELMNTVSQAFKDGKLDKFMIEREPSLSNSESGGFEIAFEAYRTLTEGKVAKFYFRLPRPGLHALPL